MIDVVSDWLYLAFGVLFWEIFWVGVCYVLLRREIKRVRAEFEKAAKETIAKEEASAIALIGAVEARLDALDKDMEEVNAWIDEEEKVAKEEEETRHAELSARGAEGVQTRHDRAELARLAYDEGAAVIRGPGTIDEKKGKLLALLQAYPDVAISVGKRLNRAFRISDAFGISEAQLLQIVAQEAAKTFQTGQHVAAAVPEGY